MATFGSAVRTRGILLEVRARLSVATRKGLETEAGRLVCAPDEALAPRWVRRFAASSAPMKAALPQLGIQRVPRFIASSQGDPMLPLYSAEGREGA